jgi:hypothetical protein
MVRSARCWERQGMLSGRMRAREMANDNMKFGEW